MKILINDQFVEKEKATVSLFSEGLMFGVGIFETLRTYDNKKLFQLKPHIDRLLSSAEYIGLTVRYSKAEIEKMVLKTVISEKEDQPLRVKIMAIPDQLVVIATPFKPDGSIYSGVCLKSVCQRRSLPEVKSICYLDALLSYQKAHSEGYYDALLIDENQMIYEGSRTNIFWFDGKILKSREMDVLPGITRDVIRNMVGEAFQFDQIRLEELKKATEVFVTNSVIGIAPVTRIDKSVIGTGQVGERTQALIEQYQRRVTQEINI